MLRVGARTRLVAVGVALVAAYSWVWYRNAWITDDAFITFRTVEQFLAGNGLRFNVHERVQSFTHPLWLALLLLPRALGVALPAAAFALSWGAAVGALTALARLARGETARWVVAAALLAVSRTLLDFSSSGLETPLSLLLVVAFVRLALRGDGEPAGQARSLLPLSLAAAALLLTRHDHAALLAPALALAVVVRARATGARRAAVELLAGLSPFFVWSLFALGYYGSTLPNTGLAKLATGVPAGDLARQGVRYLVVSAGWDPLLALLLALGGWAAWRGGPMARALGLGGVLHLVYVVAVGGDFMAGRFVLPTAALALALAVAYAPRRALALGALPAALLVGLLWPRSPLRTDDGYRPAWNLGDPGTSGIEDQKGNAPGAQWLRGGGLAGEPRPALEPLGPPRAYGLLGRPGYAAALGQILVDPYALSDPLLARLPHDPPWHIGHFRRRLPAGYLESLAAGENRIEDPAVAALYEDVRRLVSAPLLDPGRVGAWWRLATRWRANAPSPRCPGLILSPAPPAGDAVRRPVLVQSIEREGGRLVVRGRLPLGDRAAAWRLWVWPLDPGGEARLTCRPEEDGAPIRFELELAPPAGETAGPTELALLPARTGAAGR